MPLSIRVADRLDLLAADLATELARSPLPPETDEWIVVQSLSLRRWLQQRLAEAHGCAAGLVLPFPAGLLDELERRCALVPAAGDAWQRDRLRWRIAALAGEAAGDLAPLAAYLDAGHAAARGAKRLQLADRLADLFDGYQLYRPEMLAAWEAGRGWDGLADEAILRGHERWQAALWRRLRADLAAPPRTQRLAELCERLRRDGPPPGVPPRLGVLATGVLPPRVVDVLEALGAHLPVTVWLVSPLPQPWGDLASPREAARRGQAPAGHPLVASLGRQARDWFRDIGARAAWAESWEWIGRPPAPPTTALAHLQGLMREAGDGRPALSDDGSLALDICHGPRREVEVARDRILAAFAELPGLRADEVMVLAPDLATYGPLVEAVFAAADPAIRLPVRVADRSLGEADAVAQALLALLRLARSRAGLSELSDLLELPAVRAAADLTPDQAGQARELLERAGVRWGRDGAHRAELLDVPGAESFGTLAAALDRLCLGWATGSEGELSGLPAAAAEGAPDHELLGRVVGWLFACLDQLAAVQAARSLSAWRATLRRLVARLLTAEGSDPAAALAAIDTLAADDLPGFTPSLDEIAAALDGALGEEARATDFVSGAITLAGLKPMRTIPARVVVLLGMDDAAWPRRAVAQPFDLAAAAPRPGDRLPREDDRQLFLEAVLAARDRLIITWPGRPVSGDAAHERPPSACLAELCDAIDAAFAWDGGDEAQRPSRRLTTLHPLQPFSAAYLAADGPVTFDAAALSLARILAAPRPAEQPFVAGPLAAAEEWQPSLDELVAFWQDPAAAWCRAALGFAPRSPTEAVSDDEPLALDGLARYQLIDELVAGLRAGAEAGPLLRRRAADGRLPLGRLGVGETRRLVREAKHLAAALGAPRPPLVIVVEAADWRLEGILDPAPDGKVLRAVHAGREVPPRGRLTLALRLLAWNAWREQRGEAPGTGELVARAERAVLPACAHAQRRLGELITLARAGRAAPQPFFVKTAWSIWNRDGTEDEVAAWFATRAPWPEETATPAVALAWRGRQPLDAAAAALARRVWGLLLGEQP